VPDPEKVVKSKKSSQKGASGSGKPKKSYISPQEEVIVEIRQFEELEPSIASEESPAEIQTTPYTVSFPLDLNPKKASPTVHHIPLSLPSISLFPTI